ncbi:hypothetical protein HPB49_006666 [Dermacentor silvarum]|uniref:Uncharacterized protein n=1 Tax=Dermacentor silvarum TaxID=543639 RepID=A0ACB8C7R8_DERSI|nr:hypothetical protein HPB49_006666 [Dermacentor silvarum]
MKRVDQRLQAYEAKILDLVERRLQVFEETLTTKLLASADRTIHTVITIIMEKEITSHAYPMAFAGIAPPDPFLPTPGRPVQPWSRWHDMFKVYLVASGASEFSPERRRALLLHSLGPEGQQEEKGTAATPDVYDSAVAALAKHFDTPCNLVVERHRLIVAFSPQATVAEESVLAAQPVPSTECVPGSPTRSVAEQFPASETAPRPPVNNADGTVVSCSPARRIQPHSERRQRINIP